jgi:hypothetical protein
MSAELQELRQKRLNWVKSNQENGFDEGINRLLTELYPDNAHFIYELLQNAEDPQATEVHFKLTESSVEFTHNGKRLFTYKDVESITSIGNSTKRDDATSIGKFGVGFKAVFAYTNIPEIHSGDFHFRIRDLVVPETDGAEQYQTDSKRTRFIFPFDNPKKPAATAIQEISKGLQALSDNTLLFLSHIRKIDYTLSDGRMGSLQRIDHGDGQINIHIIKPNCEETISHWLHFQKDVEVTDDDGKTKTCRIAIAYSLVEENNKKTEEKTWKIVPLDRGQVSIYFPTEKETSNLKFHLHAPFGSTVARDSVRDCLDNEQLRDHLAELVVESLTAIRDQGLLKLSFLAALPNPADNLTGFYEPIRKAVVEVFKNESLTPTRNGSHGPSTGLFRGPARIANILNDDELSFLTNYTPPLWTANPPPQSQREENFLDSLEIESWGWSELVDVINSADEDEERERIEAWISKKEDAWLMRLYALLGEANEEHFKYVHADNIKIVRIITNKGIAHVVPSEAFFPPEDKTSAPSDILFVKPETYKAGKSNTQKELARSFLVDLGVRSFDVRTSIELKLESYENLSEEIEDWVYDEKFKSWTKKWLIRRHCEKVDASYYEDLKLFISYWKKNPTEHSLFRNKTILFGLSNENIPCWSKSDELCLDTPYIETGLAELVAIHKKKPLWFGYQDNLSKSQLKDFVDFLIAIGVMKGFLVVKAPIYKNKNYITLTNYQYYTKETNTSIQDDYSIDHLEQYLNKPSISCARLIWETLIKTSQNSIKARYRPNQQYDTHETESQFVSHLKSHAWIPNKHGDFCMPKDMSRDDLRNDFPYDDSKGMLTAIGFGENARRKSEEYRANDKKAKHLGFKSLEQARKLAELANSGISESEIEQLIASQKVIEQPTQSVPNPDRRRKGILERSESALFKENVIRERSIQPGIMPITAEAKAYLRAKYTNKYNEMVCQCCSQIMPFKIGDAYYFEATQCLKNLDKHHIENRLALCPTCSAMYLYARHDDDEKVKTAILNISEEDAAAVEIPVTLARKSHKIRFVGTHWFDLRTIIDQV